MYLVKTKIMGNITCCNVQIQRTSGLWYSAEYSTFSISDEAGKYQLTVAGYAGDAGDAMAASASGWIANGKGFSTKDSDNDEYFFGSCAHDYNTGWWFRSCSVCILNYDGNTSWSTDSSPITDDVQASRMLVKIK